MSEAENQQTPRVSSIPLLIVMGLIVVFGVIFIIEFAGLSDTGGEAIPEEQLTGDSYMDEVEPLLVDADPARAPRWLQEFDCNSCHQNNIAPGYDIIPLVAGERKPPLRSAAYIYESIIHPGAFVAEGSWGNNNNMPRNFHERLTDQQLGDIISWLLLLPEERDGLN